MAEFSGFFDAHFTDGKWDRAYVAEHFANYFSSFISNGVFGGKSSELVVRQNEVANMGIRVFPGRAFIGGYFYENDGELPLSIEIADGTLNRIDLVVLRWDNVERVIRLAVKKGKAATNPVAPFLQRDADYYELKLAEVYVKAGATNITQDRITDTRLDTDACGFVIGVVQNFDTTDFGIQINGVIKRLEKVAEENDLATLIFDVAKLEAREIESEQFPGCYYRNTADGKVEWVNPPKVPGVEYRLLERWNGKVLYQKSINIASLPNNSFAYIDTQTEFLNMIFVDGYAYNATNGQFFPFPVYLEGKNVPSAVINKMDPNGFVLLTTVEDMTAYNAEVVIKYTKRE